MCLFFRLFNNNELTFDLPIDCKRYFFLINSNLIPHGGERMEHYMYYNVS